MMHEFDRCRFCAHHDLRSDRYDKCTNVYGCIDFNYFNLDVIKVIDKAKLYEISVTDVLNLMREVNV